MQTDPLAKMTVPVDIDDLQELRRRASLGASSIEYHLRLKDAIDRAETDRLRGLKDHAAAYKRTQVDFQAVRRAMSTVARDMGIKTPSR